MSSPHLSAAPDPTTSERLRASGLESRVVTSADVPSFDAWLDVVRRGFLGGDATDEEREASRERLDYRRKTGIYDPSAPVAEAPVATLASWISELSVPGGRGIPSCAISSVTVSPTHRRRGLARALVEGELRVAASLGIPMAMLTVSESTLYGRYGFGPAATSAAITLDAKRASWTGPVVDGRIDFIPRERLRELAPALHDRVRLSSPGELEIPGAHWDGMAGTRPDAKDARSVALCSTPTSRARSAASRCTECEKTTTTSRSRSSRCTTSSPRPPTPTRRCGGSSSSSTWSARSKLTSRPSTNPSYG